MMGFFSTIFLSVFFIFCSLGCYRNVLVKGGDLPDSSEAIDIFFDGRAFVPNN